MKSIWPLILAFIIVIGGVVLFAVNKTDKEDVDVSENESINTEQITDEDGEIDPETADELDLDEEYDDMNEYDIEAAKKTDNGIVYPEEEEGAKLQFRSAKADEFYGSWKVSSGHAIYLYGELSIDIHKNGTWKGHYTDEDWIGQWTHKNGSLYLKNEFVNYKLSFTKSNKLIMQEKREGLNDTINTVLVEEE